MDEMDLIQEGRMKEREGIEAEVAQLRKQVAILTGEVPPPREGSTWMRTFTGRRIYPLNPRPEEICIEDIAHHLSLECRYSGGIFWHYSVGQHSLHVANVVGFADKSIGLQALLHDAAEAYLKDIPRPLKKSPMFAGYKRAEARMHLCICEALGCSPDQPPAIKAADLAVLNAERLVLQAVDLVPVDDTWDEREKVAPAAVKIERSEPQTVEASFLGCYRWLTEG